MTLEARLEALTQRFAAEVNALRAEMAGGGASGFDPSANNVISGEQTFTDADQPILLGLSNRQAGRIVGYIDEYGNTSYMRFAAVNGSEGGVEFERVRVTQGRIVATGFDDKFEFVVTDGGSVLTFYNSGAYARYCTFSLSSDAGNTNLYLLHDGSFKRVKVDGNGFLKVDL